MTLSEQILKTASDIQAKIWENIEALFTPMATRLLARNLTAKAFNPVYFKSPEGKAMAAKLSKGFGGLNSTPEQVLGVLAELGLGEFGQVQIEAIIGQPIPNEATRTLEVFKNVVLIQDITLITNILGIIGEFVPTTQLGQIGQELRTLVASTGITQVSGIAYPMILEPLLQERIQKELFPVFTPKILQEADILRAYIRGIYTKADAEQLFGYLGYGKNNTAMMLETAQYYPPGQDFIRFAVRDVFNSQVVESAKLMDQYPKDIEPFAAKAGMSPDILKWYWAAHWELPSPTMGYEMLHRRVIDKAQLQQLLKVSDFAPGWIDNMIAISYSPLTRVDARNMLLDGTITDKEFLSAMQDLGYNDVNAQRLLKWVSKKTEPPQKDLTQATMINSYKLGLVSRDKVKEYLTALGYDTDESELILALEDRKQEQDLITEKLEALKYQYSTGSITLTDFVKACAGLGIPETKAQAEAMKAEQGRVKNVARPSKEDILAWLKAGQINKERAQEELRKLGYSPDYIKLYVGEKLK